MRLDDARTAEVNGGRVRVGDYVTWYYRTMAGGYPVPQYDQVIGIFETKDQSGIVLRLQCDTGIRHIPALECWVE